MILGLTRLAVFGFIALSVIFILLRIYSRSVRREELEKEFDRGGIAGSRDAHIEAGLKAYEHSLRRKLIWLVYVIPTVVVVGLVYILNFQ
jgi:hypothetical protein